MAEDDEAMWTYFQRQTASIAEFWRRFGAEPDWRGKRVLEVGCGHGAMAIRIGQAGGTVLGVDLNETWIDFASRTLGERFLDLQDRVSFRAVDALTLPKGDPFDIIVSKDTFEHVEDVETLLNGLRSLLVPGGTLYAGFSPLYFSPFGDHRRAGLKLPWAHAVLPKRMVYAAATRQSGSRVLSLNDIGLNGNTPQQFRDAFNNSRFQLVDIKYNQGDKGLLPVLDRLGRRFPHLEKFTTVSIYAALRA